MSGNIQPGWDQVFANGPSTNVPAWKLRFGGDSGLDIQLVRFDSNGAPVDVSVTVDWATGNVTLNTDLVLDDVTLDDATIADLTVTGPTPTFSNASPVVSVGSGGGSPIAIFNKTETGTIAINLQNGGTTRAQIALNSSEELILQHNTAAPAEDATVTVGADAVTIAAATTTLSDASPTLAIGSGTGSPAAYVAKSEAGTCAWQCYSATVLRGDVGLSTSEVLEIRHRDGAATQDALISMSAGLIDCTIGVLLTTGGLRTGYRDAATDAAVSLTAADTGGTLTLDSTDANAKGITMTALGVGSRIRVLLRNRSSTGSYTLACTQGGTAGTVTLNATQEGCDIVYTGSIWRLETLLNGATFA